MDALGPGEADLARQDGERRRRADRVLPGRALAVDDGLQRTLDELDDFISAEHPSLYARLRPGLSDGEVDDIARDLAPYHLPADLVSLYGWHDGWEEVVDGTLVGLLPDAEFPSLGDAITNYRGWLASLGTDGWHPLWFPAFGVQSGELAILQLEPGRPAGQLYSFHAQYDLGTSYDSVTALFAAILACWRAGLLPPADMYYLTPELRALVAHHNPISRTPDGVSRREISRGATRDWPHEWKRVIGIVPAAPAPDDLVVSLADLLADPTCGRPVRAGVRAWRGTFETFVVTAGDGTAELNVLVDRRETEGFREIEGGGRFELWLVPLADRSIAAGRADDLGRIMRLPDVSWLAERVVPL